MYPISSYSSPVSHFSVLFFLLSLYYSLEVLILLENELVILVSCMNLLSVKKSKRSRFEGMFSVTDFISIETAIKFPPSTELKTLRFTSLIAGNFFTLFSRIFLVPVYPFAFGCSVYFLRFRQTETILFCWFQHGHGVSQFVLHPCPSSNLWKLLKRLVS